MEQHYPQPKQEYKVLVRCFTFNQSKYIEDTLNGFIMQKTDFPFVCVVVDDCSTDGEQEVINAFLERECKMEEAEHFDNENAFIIYVSHKSNPNCIFFFFFLKKNLYKQQEKKASLMSLWRNCCKYEALCEGDDYWIDPLKLQKQVDFMDAHEDYGLCFTDFNLTKGKRNHRSLIKEDGNYLPEIFTSTVQIGTLTVLYRLDLFKKLPKCFRNKNWPMGDHPLWIEFAHESKLKYLPSITANYRITENSASHNEDIQKEIDFIKSAYEIKNFYSEYYNFRYSESKKKCYLNIMKIAFKHQDRKCAHKYLKLAYKEKAFSLKFFIFYFGTISGIIRYLIKNIFYKE